MTGIHREDVHAAAERIGAMVRTTPTLRAEPRSAIWFKCEYMQYTGSFKARGALNQVLAAAERGALDTSVGVVVASGGNAGLAVAYAADRVGVPAEVWVPETAPAVKVERLRALGASVVAHGTEYAEASRGAADRAAATGALLCHAYDNADMVAGAGTIALELPDDLDTVLVAVGGGGLIGGIAAGVRPGVRVVSVEPVTAPTLHAALAAGTPVDVAVCGVAADSLGARRIGAIPFATLTRLGVTSLLVEDAAIVEARRRLWREHRIVVEHGAATAYAALTAGAYRPAEGERVGVILCGANTDPGDLT